MKKLAANLGRIVAIIVVVVIVAGGVVYFLGRSSDKTVTGRFASAVGVYPGTPVKILGVNVGQVSSVKPGASGVTIKMTYDSKYKLPAEVQALEVANSLVSDRYIQLTPAYKTGEPVLSSGGSIPMSKTAGPAELDDIYAALNTLSKTLGPGGVNKGGKGSGALSTLIKVGAANLRGNGAALGNSITQLSKAARTLAGSRGDLFQVVGNLRRFTGALKDSDGQVRLFNVQLAQVAGDLSSERTDLGAALHDLGIALDHVNRFVKTNRNRLHVSIRGLTTISGTLVHQKASIEEALAVAPVALANITHAYEPSLGALSTRSNLSSLTNPAQFCAVLKGAGVLTNGTLLNVIGNLTDKLGTVCDTLISQTPGLKVPDLTGLLGGLTGGLGGGLGGLGGGGGILHLGGLGSDGLPTLPIGGNS